MAIRYYQVYWEVYGNVVSGFVIHHNDESFQHSVKRYCPEMHLDHFLGMEELFRFTFEIETGEVLKGVRKTVRVTAPRITTHDDAEKIARGLASFLKRDVYTLEHDGNDELVHGWIVHQNDAAA